MTGRPQHAPMEASPSPKPARIGKALIRLFMKRVRVAEVVALTEQFRLVTLAGPALEGVQWTPGQKVQVAMGSAFVARTYTPIEWDPFNGRARILGFAHGHGPGSDWLRNLSVGDECDLFGPRASLDPGGLAGPIALLGDETSIGLAHAIRRQYPARKVTSFLEFDDASAGARVADHLAMAGVRIIERSPGDTHLAEMEAMLPALAAQGHCFVMTGKAGTVQRLHQSLKVLGLPVSRIRTKAYWAPGKSGLD